MSSYNKDKLGTLPVVIPNALKFAVPKQGPPGTRKEFRLPPATSTYATNTDNIVRFFFNNDSIIDFSRGGLAFDLTISAPGSTYARLAQGVWSIFNRVRLTTGQELEDIREYNRLHSMIFETHREPQVGAVLGSIYGYGTQAQRNVWGATPSKDYMMPLLCGLFLSGPLPMEIFTQRLQLELYLDDPRKFVETDSPGPITVTLTNIYMHYEVLYLDGPTRAGLLANAMAGARYPYNCFVFYQQPLIAANQDLLIPHSSTGISTFIHMMVNADDAYDTTVNDKFLTWNYNGAIQHQLRINNEFFPLEPTQSGDDPQSYREYLGWVKKWSFGGVYENPPTISFEDYNTDRFLVVNQLDAYPGEGLVNNVSTSEGGNNVFLRLWLSAPPAVNTTLITFVQIARSIDLVGTKLKQ